MTWLIERFATPPEAVVRWPVYEYIPANTSPLAATAVGIKARRMIQTA